MHATSSTPPPLPDPASPPVIDRALLEQRLFPAFRSLLRLGYFTFEVQGREHLPRSGPVVYVQNHAGWFALDAFILTYAISRARGIERAPFFATHPAALSSPALGSLMRRVGGVPASWFRRPERLPPEMESIAIFPEGAEGNCKPFWQAYRMRSWNRGFVRVAQARGAPVVPVAVLGGEECLPVAWTVKALEPLIGAIVGLPLVPVPLPTHWKVIFHPPVQVTARGGGMTGAQRSLEITRRIRETVQATLDRSAAQYPLGRLSSAVDTLYSRRAARSAATGASQPDPLSPEAPARRPAPPAPTAAPLADPARPAPPRRPPGQRRRKGKAVSRRRGGRRTAAPRSAEVVPPASTR